MRTQITIGQLNPGDAFRYREDGPVHYAMAAANRGGSRVREIDDAGRECTVMHNTPVIPFFNLAQQGKLAGRNAVAVTTAGRNENENH